MVTASLSQVLLAVALLAASENQTAPQPAHQQWVNESNKPRLYLVKEDPPKAKPSKDPPGKPPERPPGEKPPPAPPGKPPGRPPVSPH